MLSISLKGKRCCCYLAFVLFSVLFSLMLASNNTMGAEGVKLDAPRWISLSEYLGGLNLRWFRVQGAVQYIVQRRTEDSGEFKVLSRVNNPVYDDFMTAPGKIYFYRIVPVDSKGNAGTPSVERFYEVSEAEPESLEPPEWSVNHVRPDGIALAWNHKKPDHILAYNLYRKRPEESTFSLIASSLDINYMDRDLEKGSTYEYVITALDRKLQESNNSQVMSITFEEEKKVPATSERFAKIKTLEEVVTPTGLVNLLPWEEYGFVSPVDVDYRADDQRLYIADSGTGYISVIDPRGDVLLRLGGMGDLPWQFERLLGIALAPDGSLYAVDAYKGDVVVFSEQGGFQMRIRLQPLVKDYFGPDLMLKYPWFRFGIVDLTVGIDGSLYIVDNPNGWIYHLDEKADLVEVISGRGYKPGELQYPTFIVNGGQGELYVADTMNSRVQMLAPGGSSPQVIGEKGLGIGQFIRPKGVALDQSGFLYVADSYLNVIQVFDAEGGFATLLGNEKGLPIDLGSPNGLAFIAPDTLVVTEKLSRRIQIRKLPMKEIHESPSLAGN